MIREIYYNILISFRTRGVIFWSFIFPLVMVSIFYFIFSSFSNVGFQKIRIGLEEDSYLEEVFSEKETFEIVNINKDEMNTIDKNKKLDLAVDNDLVLYAKDLGIKETIVREMVKEVKDLEELNIKIKDYDFSKSYVEEISLDYDYFGIIYYSLFGMYIMNSSYGMISVVRGNHSELSYLGERKEVSSSKKSNFLLGGFLGNILLNIFANLVFVYYTDIVLGLSLFENKLLTFLIILLGNMLASSIGIFLASFNDKKGSIVGSLRGIFILLGAFAGMFGTNLKKGVLEGLPIMAILNPLSLISDNLLRVNLLGNKSKLSSMSLVILTYTSIFLGLSLVLKRRRKYDRI